MTRNAVNPEMIRLARDARGLTQTDLARVAGLRQGTMSKIESGVLDVSSAALCAIASALKMPEKFFYQAEPIYGASTSEFFHRKRQSVPAGVLTRVHAQINIIRMHLAVLLRAADLPLCQIPSLDLTDFNGNPREAARAVRAVLGVGSGPIPNVVKVIEDAGGLIIPCEFGVYEIDVISRWVPGMPPMFYVNMTAPVDRFRMNLAHELAHMVLHRQPEAEMETQAKEFAGELLMPAAEIKPQLYRLTLARLAQLKPYWRASMAAILKQAEDLKCISHQSARYLWMQMAKRGYKKREPAELDLMPERPTLLKELIEFHRAELGYSVSDLATALKATPKDLMALYGIELSKPETAAQFRRVK